MLQPVLRLLTTQPQLLVDHAQAYAELMALETARVARQWRRRALLLAAAVFCLLVAAVLTGVALMMWALAPGLSSQGLWTLVLVPLLPLLAALVCAWAARSAQSSAAFANVRAQLHADLLLWRQVGPT